MNAIARNRGLYGALPCPLRALIRDFCADRSHRQTPTARIFKEFLAQNALAWTRLRRCFASSIFRIAPHVPQMIHLVAGELICPHPVMPFPFDVIPVPGRALHLDDRYDEGDEDNLGNVVAVRMLPEEGELTEAGLVRPAVRIWSTYDHERVTVLEVPEV